MVLEIISIDIEKSSDCIYDKLVLFNGKQCPFIRKEEKVKKEPLPGKRKNILSFIGALPSIDHAVRNVYI